VGPFRAIAASPATAAGWLTAAALLSLGVPLFLRMPLWCDATLYAVAAREVAAGGVLYRDVFDTNPPGFVWALCAVRGTLGPSSEVARGADLLIVALVVAGLLWWARAAGARAAGLAWCAAACAAFYLFSAEFNHVQRDVWMMLPAGAALALRLGRERRQLIPPGSPSLQGGGESELGARETLSAREASFSPPPFREGGAGGVGCLSPIVEGALWGIGCWIKPHLVFVAFAVWLVTRRRLGARDHIATFAGGLLALAAGAAWLVGSGAWPHFLDVWRTWNADYLRTVMRELPFRCVMQFRYFPPYSAAALLAVPLAVANLRAPLADTSARRRTALAAVYLAWLGSALLLQRPFHYVHVPETLLMLAVFAANRWPVPGALVLLPVLAGAVVAFGGPTFAHLSPHPALDGTRARLWPRCFVSAERREVSSAAAMYAQHFGGSDPAELGPVADYLREQNVGDGELIAWHDSPHALYLELGVRPRFRFMHVGTAAGLGAWQERAVFDELCAALPGARFAVSDLHRVTERFDALNALDADGLPKVLPAWQRREFPFDQEVVFRSPRGRYLVHRITKPVTSARIPEHLDQAKPNGEK
jgi:hypothetical protein